MNIQDHTIDEHTHRFGLWTAARAASTSRFSNSEVAKFIESCNLKEAVEQLRRLTHMDHETYKEWFIRTANFIKKCMSEHKSVKQKKVTFGIAAKMLSIYIKTVEVLPTKGSSLISNVAFPPIDRFLLSNLKMKQDLKNISWSKMENDEFIQLIEQLKQLTKEEPFWKLEYYWDLNKKRALL